MPLWQALAQAWVARVRFLTFLSCLLYHVPRNAHCPGGTRMLGSERKQRIIELIERQGSVAVSDLCRRFDVSEMTIRRDLMELEAQGLLRRVRGGAISSRGRSYEPPFFLRSGEHQPEKERIGRAAAALVRNGDSIALDVGTTTLEVARHLEGKENLTIVTPSLPIANLLANRAGIRLIVTGGIVRTGEHSLVGHLAERAFKEFRVDKLFLGVGGIDLEAGLTEYNLEDALVKRAMLAAAKERIVVADASKFGRVAFASVASIDEIDRVVTDASVPSETVERLHQLDIEVILA